MACGWYHALTKPQSISLHITIILGFSFNNMTVLFTNEMREISKWVVAARADTEGGGVAITATSVNPPCTVWTHPTIVV